MNGFWPSCRHWALLFLVTGAIGGAGYFLFARHEVTTAEESIKNEEPDETLIFEALDYAALPGWRDDHVHRAIPAIRKSCDALRKKTPEHSVKPLGTVKDYRPMCQFLKNHSINGEGQAKAFIEYWLRPVRLSSSLGKDGLFTGYYEPHLHGSLQPSDRYAHPLYAAPADLIMVELGDFRDDFKGKRIAGRLNGRYLKPFESREEIENGALAGQGLELVWVDDAIDSFFLHIQGSGRIALDDGGVMRVGYSAQNGHPYYAIGRALIEWGEVAKKDMSMQAIRGWLENNPDRADELMNMNPSYIFFDILDQISENDGPLGAQGVPLTPGRSLAVDPKHIGYGAVLWLDADHPSNDQPAIQKLVVAQDTGGAIRGAIRGDLFWGAGQQAAELAGKMKSVGTYYALLPRSITLPNTSIKTNNDPAP